VTVVYGIMFGVAIFLMVGYCTLLQKKEPWLLFLYFCVIVVNLGYFLLSMSRTVEFALFANKVVYFGSVFLTVCMFLTVVKLCGFKYNKIMPIVLLSLGVFMFGIICTTGYLPWYYREVSLVFVDGAAKLSKVYGPLHPLYLIYVLGYFTAMIVTVCHSFRLKKFASRKQAILLSVVVFGNIATWLVEKFIPWNFEFLSVSYLFSEVILLGLYWMMQDYMPLSRISDVGDAMPEPELTLDEKVDRALSRLSPDVQLNPREREILPLLIENKKRKDIAIDMNLSENTVKTYVRSLYNKLGVSSREELFEMIKQA